MGIVTRRRHYVIYAVVVRDHPEIVKIGRTENWDRRRKAYDFWNLADGNGILRYAAYLLTEEYVDLASIEAECLGLMDKPRHRGNEWFRASLDDAMEIIERALVSSAISYDLMCHSAYDVALITASENLKERKKVESP